MALISSGFGDLLHQAEQLTADMDSGGDLPRVDRNLHQIMEAGQRLWTKTAQARVQEAADVKASILLGATGLDVPKISQRLETLRSAKTFEPLEPVRETDLQGFLRNEVENAVLTTIEEKRKLTFERTEKHHWDSIQTEWEQEKQKILNALIGASTDVLDIPQETESILSDGVDMKGRSAMDNVEMAYSRQLFTYNDQLVRSGVKANLTQLFEQVAEKLDDQNVIDLWTMVKYMINVSHKTAPTIVQARNTKDMQVGFVTQARKYLEESYVLYIKNTIYGNLQQAQLGGIPGTYNVVRSFLNVKLPPNTPGLEDGDVEGHPVWAVIYYCLRCGDLRAALQAVDKATQNLGEFRQYFEEYIHSEDRRLPPNSENKIHLHYRRAVKRSNDPYKRAVYCVIGHCDANENHSEIAEKTDDYLWIKLCQVHVDESNEGLSIRQFQTSLLEEYGETHFNAYQHPFLYFKVLFLTAQFEAAIEFLSRMDKLRSHAVHVAAVLYEQGLLALPVNIHAQLLSREPTDPVPTRRLNFARLITTYTRKFEMTDPREALQYFYLLRNMKDSNRESLFMKCVSELVTETREFETLLGRLERDGCRKPGVIDKFQDDTQKIIQLVARDTEQKGLFEDAVKLYDLAGNHEKVLELLNKLLSPLVSAPSSPQSTRGRCKDLALAIAERYHSQGHRGSQATTQTFYLLLDLISFFDYFHSGNLDDAMDVIQQLKLIPLTADAVESRVHAFKQYTDEIRHNLAAVLLATMNILYAQYKNIKKTSTQLPRHQGLRAEDGGRDAYINYLRKQARALITFAGMLPYRMPGDTNARLVQLEVLMQ
ncbi:nuclear pore complex protein Nup93-like [Ptychodera flava]|uniref:nuclear pore complex protein Nup93-like n=1 Tax=Ptychodera flava TaxID=63121 RepID=UPI003969BE60